MGPKRLAVRLITVLTGVALTGTAASAAAAAPPPGPAAAMTRAGLAARALTGGTLASGGALVGVTAPSARSAWAVGMTNFFGPGSRLLSVRWNGSAWLNLVSE
jgi:hypothetical protein